MQCVYANDSAMGEKRCGSGNKDSGASDSDSQCVDSRFYDAAGAVVSAAIPSGV